MGSKVGMGVVEEYLLPLREMEERIFSPHVAVIMPNGRHLLVDRIILKWGSGKLCVCVCVYVYVCGVCMCMCVWCVCVCVCGVCVWCVCMCMCVCVCVYVGVELIHV